MPLNPFAAVDAVLEAHEQVSNSKLPHAVPAKATPPSEVKFKAPPAQPAAEPARTEPVANGAPHPSLLLIRQGIAAQDKATVRAAMAAAEAAGVQIEVGMRAMLFQWLGDAPLPVATPAVAASAGVPDSAGQALPSSAVGHTGLGTSVSTAEPGVVESPHPALLQIREGIASQNRDAVRAAVASARAAQVVIEPRLYNMIMQWLSEGASQTENREMAPPAGALAPAIPTEATAETADAATAAMGMVPNASFPVADALPGVPGMPMAFPPGLIPPVAGFPTPTLPTPIYPPKAPWHMAPQPIAKVAAPALNLGMTAKGSAPPPAAHANGVATAVPLVGVNRDLAGLADEAARRRLELEVKQKRAREASKPAGLKSVDTAGLPPDAAQALLELLADPGRPVAGPGVISAAPVRRKSEALEPKAPDPSSSTGTATGAEKATPEPPAKLLKRDGTAPSEATPPPPPVEVPPVAAAPPPPPEAAPGASAAASSASDSSDDERGGEATKPTPQSPAAAAPAAVKESRAPAAAVAPKAAPSQGGQDSSAASSRELESWQYLKGNSWGAGNFFDFNSF